MPVLTNSRHEKFALNIFKGMSQKDAAISAGYSLRTCDLTAYRLIRNDKVLARIREHHEDAKSPVVMDFTRRQVRLSEIGEADLTDFIKEGVPELRKDIPYRRAASEYTVKQSYDKDGEPVITKSIKLHSPVTAIDTLNKMDRIYSDTPPIYQDNRTINIIVSSEKAKELTEGVGEFGIFNRGEAQHLVEGKG